MEDRSTAPDLLSATTDRRSVGRWVVETVRSSGGVKVRFLTRDNQVLLDDRPETLSRLAIARDVTAEDLDAAAHIDANASPGSGQELAWSFLYLIHSARAESQRAGFADGLRWARSEAAVAASEPLQRLRDAARETTGLVPTPGIRCPWYVGTTPPSKRSAQKMTFVYPFNLGIDAYRQILATVREEIGLPLTGRRNATGNHIPHCRVLAPTCSVSPPSSSAVELDQAGYTAALRHAALDRDWTSRVMAAAGYPDQTTTAED